MKRIVLRHLSGSKANQIEEFPLNHFQELVIGRDPASTVKFDADKDDLVGRQHAKILRDGPDSKQFILTDLGSRNGTYVNKERILGTVNITPGDVIQFGPGGPEFEFDLEPRPEGVARATRIAPDPTAATAIKPNGPPPTRVGNGASSSQAAFDSSVSANAAARTGVGKTTVQRMIMQNKGVSKSVVAAVALAVLFVTGVIAAGGFYWLRKRTAEVAAASAANTNQLIKDIDNRTGKVEVRTSAMNPAEIAAAYTDATVYVQVSWQLIQNKTGNPLFCKYIPNKYKDKDGKEKQFVPDGREYVAAYRAVPSPRGTLVEPYLTTNSNDAVYPVGSSHTGSGFTVTSDGFILTNLHVAYAWKTSYIFPNFAFPGVILKNDNTVMTGQDGQPEYVQPFRWVPSETQQFGGSELGRPSVEGRNDSLYVTFPKTELRIPAKAVRVSDRHDVAMLKIDIPEPLKKVELNDNYETIKPGDAAIVLGYPGGSPPEIAVIGTKANRRMYENQQYGIIPNATLSVGNIAAIHREQEAAPGKDAVYSSMGDVYQLTINSTGGGNSGGPVFDDKGKVIAIFTYGLGSDFKASGAVPIRYAKELMGVTQITK